MTTPPFQRTKCVCSDCVACCYRQPGPLAPGDFERIQAHLGVDDAAMRKLFRKSPGALVFNFATGKTYRIGTITPHRAAGRCVFLDKNDRCSIHEVAPAGCAYFDTHMRDPDATTRSNWLAKAQTDPEYQKLRDTLAPATSYKPRLAGGSHD